MDEIKATRALYIKLGESNSWFNISKNSRTLRLGFGEISHSDALSAVSSGDFSLIADYYRQRGISGGTATRYSNEVKEFYTANTDVLWITFGDGRLWWCFADLPVMDAAEADLRAVGSRYRNARGGWRDTDRAGAKLWINQLRGSLTTTAGYRGTICKVRELDYLVRRLNCEETPATKAAREARTRLICSLVPLIRGLHWKDFELLAELVVTQGGWRRISATGGEQKTIDLELEQPLTGERAILQVKSELDRTLASKISAELVSTAQGGRVFIAYHTGPDGIEVERPGVSVMDVSILSRHVVDLGLSEWVMSRVG